MAERIRTDQRDAAHRHTGRRGRNPLRRRCGGIIPESAIVTGLPEGVAEKNQDAWPALAREPARTLARPPGRSAPYLRRERRDKEQEAIIRSGPEGAVVLQTPEGVEALRCTGLNETIVYPKVPLGLSAKPTLSVRTSSARAASATITLSYLATASIGRPIMSRRSPLPKTGWSCSPG
jgi:hypothetical protein